MTDQPDARGGWRSQPPRFVVAVAGLGLVLVLAGVAAGFRQPADADVDCFDRGIVALELAGDDARVATVIAGCDPVAHPDVVGEVHDALLADLAFIGGYVLIGVVGCWFLPWGYRVRRLRGAQSMMVAAVATIGVLDLVENACLWFAVEPGDRSSLVVAATTAAWGKWLIAIVVVVYAAGALLGVSARVSASMRRRVLARGAGPGAATGAPGGPAPAVAGSDETPILAEGPLAILAVAAVGPPRRGIALSGGGIRSASYCLGALQVLDAPDAPGGPSLYRSTDLVTAVSGGGYIAGAWKVSRGGWVPEPDGSPSRAPWQEGSVEERFLREKVDYLRNGPGGLPGALLTVGIGVVVNVLVLAVLLWLVAQPLGWLSGSWYVSPRVTVDGVPTLGFELAPRLWWPPVLWWAAAVVLGIVWAFSGLAKRVPVLGGWAAAYRQHGFSVVLATGAVALGLTFLLLLLPWLLVEVPLLFERAPASEGVKEPVRILQLMSAAGITAALVTAVKKPLATFAPRLGGLLVVVLAVLALGEWASHAAEYGFRNDRGQYLWVLAIAAVVYFLVDPNWWSMQPFYRSSLRRAFVLRRTAGGGIEPIPTPEELVWGTYPSGDRPALVSCAAMNVSTGEASRVTGIPAYSFVFSDRRVGFTETQVGDGETDLHQVAPAEYFPDLRYVGRPRLSVGTSMGISGAAFSSAMGRQSKGTTQAFFALANLRLGVWMPNPRYARERDVLPRPRINYLLKELVGWFDPIDDYVNVSDGGHWENLGLTELLRRGVAEAVCVDASGSKPDSFGTIGEAVALAAQEAGLRIEIDLEPLRSACPAPGEPMPFSDRDVAVGVVYAPGIDGTDTFRSLLWLAKLSVTRDAPTRVLSYRERKPAFPADPTLDQFFDVEQFECYRLLGRHTATNLVELRERLRLDVEVAIEGGGHELAPATTGDDPFATVRAALAGHRVTLEQLAQAMA